MLLPLRCHVSDSIPPEPSAPPAASATLTTGSYAAVRTSAPSGGTLTTLSNAMHLPQRRTLLPWLIAVFVCAVLYLLREAVLLALLAFALAYAVSPAVKRLERLRVPRSLSIITVLVVGLGLVATTVAVLVPELVRQSRSLAAQIPGYAEAIKMRWIPFLRDRMHLPLPHDNDQAMERLGLSPSQLLPRVTSFFDANFSRSLAVTTVTAAEGVLTAFIVGALAFYMLQGFEETVLGAYELLPHWLRPRVRTIAVEVDRTLRHFVTGQLLVMAVLGGLFALGLVLLGVPAGWAIGLFAGLISFVPYLGFFTALGLALLMTALQGRGPVQFLAVMGVMGAVHILDLTLITPRILGDRARLSPVWVILALVAGASLAGFAGVLMAIPAASVLGVLVRELIDWYKSTNFFLAGSGPDPLATTPLRGMPTALESQLNAALLSPQLTPVPAPFEASPSPSLAPPPPPSPSSEG